MIKTHAGCALALLLASGNAQPADEPKPNDPVRAGWYAAPMFTYIKADEIRRSGNGKGGVLAFGHHAEVASIEVAGIYASLTEGGAQLTGGQLALLVGPFFEQPILSRFFGVVAFGAFQEKAIPALNQDGSGLFGDLGLGYYQPLFGRGINLRVEARRRWDYPMAPRAANEPSYFEDWAFNLGVQIPLSRAPVKPPPPRPEPVAVVEAPPAAPPPPPKCEAGEIVTMDGCKAGDKLVLTGVNFATNEATLTPGALGVLDSAAEALSKRPEIKVEVGGHTDSQGSDAHNQGLSDRRANAVRDYLITKGVAGDRMTAMGYGEGQPVDSNDTDAGRARNRRVEFTMSGGEG